MAAARKRASQATDAASALRSSPYIQRIIGDAELRNNIRDAFTVTRSAYDRLSNGKAPSKALMEDKKLQRDLREAATSLRNIGITLKDGPARKRKHGIGRKLLVLGVGAGLALALSEGLRKKVLDTLFGAEEEFDYTSTTSPDPAPPVAA